MNLPRWSRFSSYVLDSALIVLVTLLSIASPVASGPARASAVAGVLPDASPDSLLVLLPPRTEETVRRDLTTAEAAETSAGTDLVSAQGRLGEVKAHIEVRKSEIETIKAKIKLAKEQKNQTEQVNLEREAKMKDLQMKVLEARKEMREAEVNLADTRRKTAQTQSGFFKKELELIGKRDDQLKMSSAGEGATNLDGLIRLQIEIRDLERRCIEILKDVVEREKNVADGETSLLEKRLELHEAQLALLQGPKK